METRMGLGDLITYGDSLRGFYVWKVIEIKKKKDSLWVEGNLKRGRCDQNP